MCAQSMALGTHTKFQLEILTINGIFGIVYFRKISLESSQNVSETTPRHVAKGKQADGFGRRWSTTKALRAPSGPTANKPKTRFIYWAGILTYLGTAESEHLLRDDCDTYTFVRVLVKQPWINGLCLGLKGTYLYNRSISSLFNGNYYCLLLPKNNLYRFISISCGCGFL